jgi:peptide/nickel transport system substrate-binding protein
MWMAQGEGGQRLFIIPKLQLIIAITAGNYGKEDQWMPPTRILREVALGSRADQRTLKAHREADMAWKRNLLALARLLCGIILAAPTQAQKRGGVLTMISPDSPGGLSLLEEATVFAQGPMAGVFNNLVMMNQHARHNSMEEIVPDLATSWSWSEDGRALTFKLREGVTFHDGAPFTARDVLCTMALLMETGIDKLRVNPRKVAVQDVETVTASGDHEVTFRMKAARPWFPMFLAGGFSVIYPCHVKPAAMRTHPIGTGPYKFVEFRPNESIKVVRNPNYWKPELPYLDGIEYTIIRDPATAVLSFIAGKFDMTFPTTLTPSQFKDIQTQKPDAICQMTPGGGINRHMLINRTKPPFDNPDVRRAMALSLDRQAFVDIISEGQGDIGANLQPPSGGLWGMPPEMLKTLPGYDPDVAKNREQARAMMRGLGYGPDNRLKVKVMTRDLSFYKAPAIVLIDQLKEVYLEGELDPVETPAFFPRVYRKDYAVALNLQTSGPDPGAVMEAYYKCGSNTNWDGYCDAGVDQLIEQQWMETDVRRRKELLWTIERKLAQDVARPIIFYVHAGSCWKPDVKGVSLMEDSIFAGNRREDLWLDR